MFGRAFTLALAPSLLGACATVPLQEAPLASGDLVRSDGRVTGSASLIERNGRLLLRLSVAGFEPGTRALHLHQKGKCDTPDFMSAGGHLNPFGRTHGRLSETGQHLGDLPNLEIPASGAAEVTLEIDGASDALRHHLFDADGTSVMVHAGADDYRTDPTGGAGARVACAVLTKAV